MTELYAGNRSIENGLIAMSGGKTHLPWVDWLGEKAYYDGHNKRNNKQDAPKVKVVNFAHDVRHKVRFTGPAGWWWWECDILQEKPQDTHKQANHEAPKRTLQYTHIYMYIGLLSYIPAIYTYIHVHRPTVGYTCNTHVFTVYTVRAYLQRENLANQRNACFVGAQQAQYLFLSISYPIFTNIFCSALDIFFVNNLSY